jgi:hypothetical protein
MRAGPEFPALFYLVRAEKRLLIDRELIAETA